MIVTVAAGQPKARCTVKQSASAAFVGWQRSVASDVSQMRIRNAHTLGSRSVLPPKKSSSFIVGFIINKKRLSTVIISSVVSLLVHFDRL